MSDPLRMRFPRWMSRMGEEPAVSCVGGDT